LTPLFKKLNLGEIETILVLNSPDSFASELDDLQGVTIIRRIDVRSPASFAMGFAVTQSEFGDISLQLVNGTVNDAIVWLAYPKQSSNRFKCEFNRDSGWNVLGDAGFEPVRQVSIDSDWSALRFRRVAYIKSLSRQKSMAISSEGKRRTTR